ncbi:MAG TPA: methyltransferase domain-containing protein [Gemmatimonadales bacterium]
MANWRFTAAVRDAPEIIRRFADGAEPRELHEFLVFTRSVFVRTDGGIAACPRAVVEAFLEPARGLPAEALRRRMLGRLARIVPNAAFAVGAGEPPRSIGRRELAREVARRAGPRRARVTQDEAVRAERRAVPFYLAVQEVFGPPRPDTLHYAPVIERAAAFLAHRQQPRALDIACGFRLLLKGLSERVPAARCLGADLLPFGANFISQHDRQPLRDRSFDLVISTSLLDHLVDPPTLAREMARLVKPDGRVITIATASHTIHLNRNPWSYVEGLLSTAWPGILPPPPLFLEPLTDLPMPWNFFHRSEMRAMFEEHFDEVRVTPLHFRHLRKFGLENAASWVPVLRNFGGLLMTEASGPRVR